MIYFFPSSLHSPFFLVTAIYDCLQMHKTTEEEEGKGEEEEEYKDEGTDDKGEKYKSHYKR